MSSVRIGLARRTQSSKAQQNSTAKLASSVPAADEGISAVDCCVSEIVEVEDLLGSGVGIKRLHPPSMNSHSMRNARREASRKRTKRPLVNSLCTRMKMLMYVSARENERNQSYTNQIMAPSRSDSRQLPRSRMSAYVFAVFFFRIA